MENVNEALDLLEQHIAQRLAPVCADMPPESFRELVHEVALMKVKYGVQSLSSEERDGPISEVVVMARVVTAEEETRNSAA
jgi:hypothetical protein